MQQLSVRQMRPLTEEAQQTLPKSVDNTVATVGDLTQARGANMSAMQSGSPVDFHQQFLQSKNVEAVLQQMHGRQRAADLQQAAAQSQVLSGAYGSVHADRLPLQHEAILRKHDELRSLVRTLRPEERSLVANANVARTLRGYPEQFFIGSNADTRTTTSLSGFSQQI